MIEGAFSISCSQCGGEEFQELFPVPAETYALYAGQGAARTTRHLTAAVFACLQCGHLEKFVELSEKETPPGGERPKPASHPPAAPRTRRPG